MSEWLWLLAVPLLVVLNGFFVAAEFALVSIRRTRVDELVAAGSGAANAVQGALRDLDGYIAGTQVGITLASLGLGMAGEPAIARLLEPHLGWIPGVGSTVAAHGVAVGIAFAVITFLHVVLGELVPKSLALQRTEGTALAVARPLRLAVWAMRPLIWSLNGVGNITLKLFGLHAGGEHTSVHSVEELAILAHQSREAGVIDSKEHELVARGLRFGEHVAREAMVHRNDVVALDITKPVEALLAQIAAARHTRYPVYEGDSDHIIGVLNARRLLSAVLNNDRPSDLRPLVRPPLLVPETLNLEQVLERFRQEGAELAVVVDEFGGTSGIITLEDLIEEVFGELDAADDPVRIDAEGLTRIRGDARLYEVNAELGWNLEDPNADTLGGFVVTRLGRTAKVGDDCAIPGGTLRVERMHSLRIAQLAWIPDPASDGGGEAPA